MALSPKHQAFVNEYFIRNMNGTEAYMQVYPNSSYHSARANAAKLLATDSIAEEIKFRLNEKHLLADEVIARLSDMAKATMADFIRFEDGISLPFLDLKGANEKGLLHLVKKFKYNADGKPEIELHDSQSALEKVGKLLGLFTDRIEHTGPDGGPIQFTEVIIELPPDDTLEG